MAVLSYLKARPRGFLPPLARYHQVLTAHKSRVEEVRAEWQAAKQELDENYELWVRMNSGGRMMWWLFWLILGMFIGIFIGLLVIGLMQMNREAIEIEEME